MSSKALNERSAHSVYPVVNVRTTEYTEYTEPHGKAPMTFLTTCDTFDR